MEPNNGLGGGMFSGINSGLLGVDPNNPLQHHEQQQNPHHMHHQPHMVPFGSSEHDTTADTHQQQPINQHGNYPSFSAKNNNQQGSPSDEDDPDTTSGDPNQIIRKNSNISPWQRMKWTDTMVRLLIMAVYYIGDEGGLTSEGTSTDPNGNKKVTKSPTGLLQKKGKWKSVSRAMMEKGFCVSPQQCEDKFNDLNKRYKRVNDILGKGTACKVVENQKLLDTMDHLSPKMKEQVRKLLNSKHLFFREMCAYHNSCGHGANNSGGGSVPHQADVGSDASQAQQQEQQQQQKCFHSSDEGVANLGVLKLGCGELDDDDDDGGDEDDDEDDNESEDYSDDDEDGSGEGGSKDHQGGHGHEDDHEDNENNDHEIIRSSRNNKRSRKAPSSSSQLMQQLSNEVSGVFQDGGKSLWEKKQWLRSRIVQLEEQQVSYQSQAFELEMQRLKWGRFSSKKEREMEKAKLENEKRRLENERLVLLIRQKELELMNLQQQQHSST